MRTSAREWTQELRQKASEATQAYQNQAGVVAQIQARRKKALEQVEQAHVRLAKLWQDMGAETPLGPDIDRRLQPHRQRHQQLEASVREALAVAQRQTLAADEALQQAQAEQSRLVRERTVWERGLEDVLSKTEGWTVNREQLAEVDRLQEEAEDRSRMTSEEVELRREEFLRDPLWAYLETSKTNPVHAQGWRQRWDAVVAGWARYPQNRALLTQVEDRATAWSNQVDTLSARGRQLESDAKAMLRTQGGAAWAQWDVRQSDAVAKVAREQATRQDAQAEQARIQEQLQVFEAGMDDDTQAMRRILDAAIQSLDVRTAQKYAARTAGGDDDLVVQQWRDAHQEWLDQGRHLDQAQSVLEQQTRQQAYWAAQVDENRRRGCHDDDYLFEASAAEMLGWLSAGRTDAWDRIRSSRREKPRPVVMSSPSRSSSPSSGSFGGGGFGGSGGFGGGGFKSSGSFGGGGFKTTGGF